MALVDYNNKIIYWDEVNWKWLPHVRVEPEGHCYFIKDGTATPIKRKEDATRLLGSIGYRLIPIQTLGVTEIYRSSFIYKGKVYKVSNKKPSIATLISGIIGKSNTWVTREIEGKGVLSESIFDELRFKGLNVEYKGKFYNGYTKLARELGIHPTTIYQGLSKGMTVDEILENHKSRSVKDYLGNQFDSVKDMYAHWGIRRDTYNSRLRKGWSLEEALTTPLMNNKRCKDHLGNEYESKGDMFKTYGVSYSAFTKRIDRGWSLGEALTGKKKKNRK